MGAYSEAGVDIDRGNRIVDRIKEFIHEQTGFAAVSSHGRSGQNIVLSNDGVGTKSTLINRIDWDAAPAILGQDVVGMVFNDIITTGARPEYFLDYIAMNRLDEDYVVALVKAIHEACEECGARLVGGETAEMPNHFSDPRKVEVVGFGVGSTLDAVMDGSRIAEGDVLVGLRSSGPHANGYSLINKLVDGAKLSLFDVVGSHTRRDLMAPTRLYYPILNKMSAVLYDFEDIPVFDPLGVVRATAHITGGGIIDNVPRMFWSKDDGIMAVMDYDALDHMRPLVFDEIMKAGDISEGEMFRTFNMGLGFVLCVNERYVERVIDAFRRIGETVYIVGTIANRPSDMPQVGFE